MKRRLFTILSALSLLLFIGVAGLWVRGTWFIDVFGWVSEAKTSALLERSEYTVMLHSALQVEIMHYSARPVTGQASASQARPSYTSGPFHNTHARPPEWLSCLWFQYRNYTTPPRSRLRAGLMRSLTLVVPWWFCLTVTSVLPILWLVRLYVRRRQLRLGRCVSCGYDLRATPDRCPECGTAVPAGHTPEVGR